jgi:uncharacterized membrane protein YeiH
VVLRSELYATPALVGAALAVAGESAGLPTWIFAVPAAAVATTWRLLAVWRGWNAPKPPGSPST